MFELTNKWNAQEIFQFNKINDSKRMVDGISISDNNLTTIQNSQSQVTLDQGPTMFDEHSNDEL